MPSLSHPTFATDSDFSDCWYRFFLVSSGSRSCPRPSNVALTALNGFPLPNVFAMMFWGPCHFKQNPDSASSNNSGPFFRRFEQNMFRPKVSMNLVRNGFILQRDTNQLFFGSLHGFRNSRRNFGGFFLFQRRPSLLHPQRLPRRKTKIAFPPLTTFATRLITTGLSFKFNSSTLTRTEMNSSRLYEFLNSLNLTSDPEYNNS